MTSPSLPGGTVAARLEQGLVGEATRRGRHIGCQGVAGPADDDSAVADRSPDDPHRVGERVAEQGSLVVDLRLRHDHADGAAGTERQTGHPGGDGAGAQVAEGSVAGAGDHGRAGRQSESSAASGDRASVAVVATMGGSWSTETPDSAIAAGLQVRVAMSSSPVPDAEDSSVTSVPVSR